MTFPATITDDRGVPALGIADRLLVARRLTKLGTVEFAEATGISKATINNYENPEYPRARKPLYLKAWALACGVSYKWLATGEEPTPDDDPGITVKSEFACTRSGQIEGATVIQLSPCAA